MKIPFQLNADLFRKGETIVHEAIREVLVNALIHADYQGMGGIVIEKYQDRFELSNPGTLLVSIDQLFNGNISECRNKTLQTIFMMLGTGEKAGSGIDKIRLGWESQHWRLPRVTEQMQPDRVMWMLPMLSLIPEESLQRLKLQFGTDFEYFSNLEVQALVTADIEKRVDNRRLQQISGEHTTDITNLLRSLVSNNKLVKKGLGRWSWYHLPEITEQPGTNADSLGNAHHSLGNETYSLGKENQFLDYETELLRIASPARLKKRLPAEEMKKIILLLCSARWLSRVQISELVNRNSEDLRKRFINPMVSKKLLRLRYPEALNRTDQAYQTISVSD